MRTVAISKSMIAASANCVALAQVVTAGSNVIINGGSAVVGPFGPFASTTTVAVLDTQRQIQIVSAGNDLGKTVTIQGYGDGGNGVDISESLALTNGGTATSFFSYLGVAEITPSATTSSLTVGTNTTGATPWFITNFHLTPFLLNSQVELTGSVTWSLNVTNDVGWWVPPASNAGNNLQPHINPVIAGSTIAQNSTITSAVTGYQYVITAGTGTLSAQTIQSGLTNM